MSSRYYQINNVGLFAYTTEDGRLAVFYSDLSPSKIRVRNNDTLAEANVPESELRYHFGREVIDAETNERTLASVEVPPHSPLWYEAIRSEAEARTDEWIAAYVP